MKIRKYKNFVSCFNERTGEYFRTGIIKNGVDTGTDPFMAPFPELLDVGIMGHCIHGKRGLCMAAGVECYQMVCIQICKICLWRILKKLQNNAAEKSISCSWGVVVIRISMKTLKTF